ncbi:MAG: Ig-like domain-containing protein [Synergistaceae bacterium]|nr:Ig-like domain-containing protein [Synergistaceae bacterium]
MGLASSIDTQIAIVPETVWGVTPSSPVFQKLRITGESLVAGLGTVESQELRPDRNVSDVALVSANASGSLNFELSYSTFDELIAAVMFGAWTRNALKNGASSNMKSFTIEKRFDLGGSYEYFRYRGMVPNSMTLTLGVDAIITGSFEFMGVREDIAGGALFGATYQESTHNPVLNATSSFAELSIDGDSQNFIASMDMTANNNLRAQRAVAHLESIGIGTGQFSVTGSMNVYFRSREIYNKYISNESVSLSFVLGQDGGMRYKFTIPRIKFTNGSVLAENRGADLMCNMTYQAILDPVLGATMKIERDIGVPPAPVPVTGVVLDMHAAELSVGNSVTLIAHVLPDNASDQVVTWSTDDDDVADVENGVVTGIGAGSATITATAGEGFTDTCDVTVA